MITVCSTVQLRCALLVTVREMTCTHVGNTSARAVVTTTAPLKLLRQQNIRAGTAQRRGSRRRRRRRRTTYPVEM